MKNLEWTKTSCGCLLGGWVVLSFFLALGASFVFSALTAAILKDSGYPYSTEFNSPTAYALLAINSCCFWAMSSAIGALGGWLFLKLTAKDHADAATP